MKSIALICLAAVLILIPIMGVNCDCDGDSGWKTYRDEEHGLRFDYPEDWVVNEDNLSGGEIKVGPDLDGSPENVLVTVESADGMSLDEFKNVVESTFSAPYVQNVVIVNKDYVDVNGMQGYEWIVKFSIIDPYTKQKLLDVKQKMDAFIVHDTAYGITLIALPSTYGDYSGIFDTILDSFVIDS